MKDSRTNMKKRPVSASAVVRIIIWSVVLCLLTGLLAWGLEEDGGGEIFPSLNLAGYRYSDKGFSVGNGSSEEKITEISIDWLAGSVTVLAAEGDEIVITEDYDGEDGGLRLRWKIEGGKLTVKYCKPRSFGKVKADEKNLTVAIPASMLDSMGEVEIVSVDTVVSYTGNADELSLDAVNGELTVIGDVGELEVDAVEAQVIFRGGVRKAEVDCVNADATMYLDMAKELKFDQVDGSVVLYLADEITGFAVEVEALSGDIEADGYEGVEYTGKRSARWGDGSLRIYVNGVAGQLKIEKLIES